MKVLKTIGLLALAVLIIQVGNSVNALELGSEAPKTDVQMKNVDGSMVSINDIQGENGTLVIFTCNSCPWAQAWEERIAEIGNTFQDQGIGVIAINSNDPNAKPQDSFAEMQERADDLGLQFPYVVDATSNVAREFGATKTPEAYLFDSNGNLVYHGAIDDNANNPAQVSETYLRDALNAVVQGEQIQTNQTRSIGCEIKFRESTST